MEGVEQAELPQRHEQPHQRGTVRHDAVGRGTRNTAGTTTSTNRIARNSSGGTPAMPTSMTTKFSPPQQGDEGGEARSHDGSRPQAWGPAP